VDTRSRRLRLALTGVDWGKPNAYGHSYRYGNACHNRHSHGHSYCYGNGESNCYNYSHGFSFRYSYCHIYTYSGSVIEYLDTSAGAHGR
jgi:hypothetical protein